MPSKPGTTIPHSILGKKICCGAADGGQGVVLNEFAPKKSLIDEVAVLSL